MDEKDQQFLDIIEKFGWHVTQVRNRRGENGPTFSYSTGIYKKLGAPEIIVFGLSDALEKSIINGYGQDIESRRREFTAGNFYDGFLEGFDVCFIEANETAQKEYACWTDWFYERKPFPLLQCVYPNTSGIWPWESRSSEEFRQAQPLFGLPPSSDKHK